jgi:DNA gyrase subunit B
VEQLGQSLIEALQRGGIKRFRVVPDPSEQGYECVVETSLAGSRRKTVVNWSLLASPEFKELCRLLDQASRLVQVPYDVEYGSGTTRFESYLPFISFVEELGRKGISVQRFKGLGEMNADELWDTTMDPDKRTLLRVSVDDPFEADQVFTILMGDQVEPRRDFIASNAHNVRNLDV